MESNIRTRVSTLLKRIRHALHMHFVRCYMDDEQWALHQEAIRNPPLLEWKDGYAIVHFDKNKR